MTKLALSARFVGALFTGLLILTANLEVSAVRPVSSAPSYTISTIKAMLFYDGKGTFSRDVLAKPDFAFWNTIIGEGDAEHPSDTTMVLVEVTGKPDSDEPLRKIEFTAAYQYYRKQVKRAVSIKRVVEIGSIGSIDKPGKSYIAFWLNNTGCYPVKITARIIGQAQPSTMSKTIPFACGE
jgi:hypothetical protein